MVHHPLTNSPDTLSGRQLTSRRKIPWRLSRPQKARQRKRLRAVDAVISTVDNALAKQGLTLKAVERWKAEMPREEEMLPKDKYTIFDRKEKRYRKGVHSMCCFLGGRDYGTRNFAVPLAILANFMDRMCYGARWLI